MGTRKTRSERKKIMDFENIKKFLKSINLLIIIFVLLYITNIVAAYLANFKVNDNISVSISMIC